MISEAEAREIIGMEGAAVLDGIIRGAWQDHVGEGRPRHVRTRASVVWDYMISRAEDQLVGMEGVRRAETYGVPAYVLRDRMALRFKKHNRELFTSNVPTGHQQRLADRGYLDGLPGVAYVSCGYILDRAQAGVEHTVVVRKVMGVVEWSIALVDLAGGQMQPTTPIMPYPSTGDSEEPPLPGIAIRRPREEDSGQ